MAKNRAVHTTKFTMNGKTTTIETNIFGNTGHNNYSGFGAHESKRRKAERRDRKMEEKRAKFYREGGEW